MFLTGIVRGRHLFHQHNIPQVVDGELSKLDHSAAIASSHPWDAAVSPTGDLFYSDYSQKQLVRLVCDDPDGLFACAEDNGLPFPECNRRFECETGYGGENCDQPMSVTREM